MRTVLYVGRVARIKGLDNLCQAFASIDRKDWHLKIVGPDSENYVAELEARVKALGVSSFVKFAGPKYGGALDMEYASADLFVLPSYSENFGSVVIEALAHCVPVIASIGTPWQVLEDRKCGWWIDIGVEPLAKALSEAMSLSPDELQSMGKRGQKLVEEKYTWDAVVKAMVKGYEEILNARS